MKKSALFLLVIFVSIFSWAQVSKSVSSTAGGLSTAIGADFNTVTNLTVSGNINAKDFVTLFNMPVLSVLDLSAVTIDSYVGIDGPLGAAKGGLANQYSPNTVPQNSFYQNRSSKTSLTAVILPTSLISIGESSFYGCSGLNSVTFPNSLNTIDYFAFSNCSSLSDLTIPASVTSLNITAFQGCTGLNSITVDASNPNYSSANDVLFNKNQTLLLKCAPLKVGTYSIPTTVTTLYEGSFMDCKNLTSLSIPLSVTTIGLNVLKNCTALASIYVSHTTPVSLSVQASYFTGINMSTCVLYVPVGSLNAYSTAAQWLSFTNIVESNSIPYLTVSATTLSVAAVANSTTTFDILSNVSWSATSTQSWLTVGSNPGSNNATITLTGEANPSITARNASVIIQGEGLASKTIIVTQTAGVPGLSVSADSLLVEASGSSTAQFNVYSTVSWEISSNQSWLQANILSGSGNALITLYASGNALLQSREATVTVSANGLPSQTIIVTQSEWKPILTVSKNTLTVAGSYNSTDVFVIGSNISWNISSDQTWLRVSHATGSNNQNITVTADLNPSIYGRTATVTVSGTNVTSQIITVNQSGKSPTLYVPTTYLHLDAANNSKTELSISSSTSWQISCDQPWLSFNKTSDWDDLILIVTASENLSNNTRTATITISGNGVNSETVSVTQASAAQISKTLNISSGDLISALTHSEAISITNLSISGTIDDRDFKYLRDSMPELQQLDLSNATITARIENSVIMCNANEIPYNAFHETGKTNYLSGIILPDNLTSIGTYAFYDCTNLKTVQFPATLVYLNEYAFTRCRSLTSLTIPPSVTHIRAWAFYGCTGLLTTNIPTTPTIDNLTFQNTTGMFTVDADNPYFSGQDGILFDKGKSKLMVFPPSKTGNYNIPNSVTYLANQCFVNCVGLNSVNIPSTVNFIASYSFYNCSASLNVDSNNPNYTSIDGVLYTKNVSAIEQCPVSKTGNFVIPSTVTRINEAAFVNCTGLTSVTIPSTVTSIEQSAFIGCEGLTAINSNIVNPLAISDIFRNVNKTTCTLYVPVGTVNSYRATPFWQDFQNIVENVSTNTPDKPTDSIRVIFNNSDKSLIINGLKGNAVVTLIDLNGKVFLSKQISENETISMNSYPKGIYIVKIITSEGTYNQKILNF